MNIVAQKVIEHNEKLEAIRRETNTKIAQDCLVNIEEKLESILASEDANNIEYLLNFSWPMAEGMRDSDILNIYSDIENDLKARGFKIKAFAEPNSNVLAIRVTW